MDFNSIIDRIVAAEGGYTNDPNDRGGETIYGISRVSFPEEWVNGPPTLQRAREIYMDKFVKGPGFDTIPAGYESVTAQLIDWSVTSGPYIPVMELQRIVGVAPDGKLGPQTLAALVKQDARQLNNALVRARVLMLGRIIAKAPSQVRFLNGWLHRAFDFLV